MQVKLKVGWNKTGREKVEMWEEKIDGREGKEVKLGIEGGRNASKRTKRKKKQGRKGRKK